MATWGVFVVRNHTQVKIGGLIALLGVALTGLLVYGALALVPPRYVASASVLLLPGEKVIPTDANPFLFLGGVTQARDVLVTIASSETVNADLRSDDSDASYAVTGDAASGTPMILVTASGGEPSAVLGLRDDVVAILKKELTSIQDKADTPSGSRIRSMVLVSDESPQRDTKSQLRAIVMAVFAGIGMTFAALAAVRPILARRPERQVIAQISPGQVVAEPSIPEAVDPLTIVTEPSNPRSAGSRPVSPGTHASTSRSRNGMVSSAAATRT